MDELKPCPFCGSKEIRQAGYFEGNEMIHFVFCADCGARTQPTRRGRGTGAEVRMLFEQKAAEAWNRRTGDYDRLSLLLKGEEVRCPKCKKGIIKPAYYDPEQMELKDVTFFKCSDCDYYIERLPAGVIVD